MVCLTDFEGWSGPYDFVPLLHNWPGYFSKMELLRPGLFSGPVLYFDLDSLILGPIDGLQLRLCNSTHPSLFLLSDFYNPKIAASGVMAWLPSAETERIYHEYAAKPEFSDRWDRGDGFHIGRHPHLRLQPMFPGVFGSYKKDRLQDGPRGFKIISFHGKPKFNDLPPAHWTNIVWRGEDGPNKPSDQPR